MTDQFTTIYTLSGWRVLRLNGSTYASRAHQSKTFARHLTKCFNDNNQGVMSRFELGNDSWLPPIQGGKEVTPMWVDRWMHK